MTADPSVTTWRTLTSTLPEDATARHLTATVHAACTHQVDLETRLHIAEATNHVLTELIYGLLEKR